jgi:hypothetical protein
MENTQKPHWFLKLIALAACICVMIAVVTLCTGCASLVAKLPHQEPVHGTLAKDWYDPTSVSYDSEGTFTSWDGPDKSLRHMCQYSDGVVVNVGRHLCPKQM